MREPVTGEPQDLFCWDGTGAAGAAPAPVIGAPTRRRRPWAIAGAGAIVIGGVLAALVLSGGGSGGGAQGQTVLAQVADATTNVPGYKFNVAMSVSADGRNVAFNANGEFNTQPLNGSVSVEVAGRDVNELLVPPYAYLEIPGATSTWQRIDLAGLGSSGLGSDVDVQQTIAFLRTVGTVTTVGTAAIGGVATTQYRAVIDVNRLAAALPLPKGASSASGLAALANALGGSGLPLDVWVDAQERVRQITMSIPLQAGTSGVQFSLTMKLYDYGSQPVVSAPPAGEVSALGASGQSPTD
jgi:hypothetical protein